jgi:hypothetical protein
LPAIGSPDAQNTQCVAERDLLHLATLWISSATAELFKKDVSHHLYMRDDFNAEPKRRINFHDVGD